MTELEVFEALRSLAASYAAGVDRRELDLFLSAFHPDAILAVHRADEEPALMSGHAEIGRAPAKLDAAAATLAADGLGVRTAPADALNGADVAAAVETASDDGALDVAVVVPGGGSIKPVLLYGDDEFSHEVDLNVRPVYL